MPKGRVIKAQNSFFYVQAGQKIISCKLRGKFRKRMPVYPGDEVEFGFLPDGSGVVENVLERRNLLRRPAVANVDQVVLTFAAAQPELHPLLLNRFLVLAESSSVPGIVICVNKMDLCQSTREDVLALYESIGYPVLRTSTKDRTGLDDVCRILAGRTTVFAGPSGVGKSSLLNRINPSLSLGTGEVSEKIKRGRHTTRIAQLLPCEGGYIVDTPGFSAMEFPELEETDLARYFREFVPYFEECRFSPCTHSHEPQCRVKSAVDAGEISRERYDAYLGILAEIRNRKKGYG